ncbi:MAG: glycoside hydrolase family 13 protein [Anaerolineae bacterium]|jgi:glycosidase
MTTDISIHAPEWVPDAVFYQIFPDRFAISENVVKPTNLEPWGAAPTCHGFKGGDLLGVVEHLDYLQDLGINAIYFNPIFQSTANHRYHTYDYYEIDPILGGNEAFRTLLDAAHQRSIRIVIDGVFNHASRGFFQFNHILENGPQSPYLDWFIINGFPLNAYTADEKPNYAAWWNLPDLPKLNTDNDRVREFLMTVAEHWIREGIDGWRLDVPLDIKTPGFWETFRRRCKAVDPETYILAEIWEQAADWLQGEHFDGVMNYPLNRACLGFFGGESLDTSFQPGGFPIAPLDGPAFANAVKRAMESIPWPVALTQLNLLSSHDMPRFLTLVQGDTRRMKLAVLFLMTFPGAPCVYYGDEIGLQGEKDPDNRRAFPWDKDQWDTDLRSWFRRCVGLRHQHAALRRGTFEQLHAGETTYAFARRLNGTTLVAAFNAGTSEATISLRLSECAGDQYALEDVFSSQSHRVENDSIDLTLPALSGTLLRCVENAR